MDPLPSNIRKAILRFVHRRRMAAILRALALTLALSMLWMTAWAVVDRFVNLSNLTREFLLALLMALVVVMHIRPLRAIFRRQIDWQLAARQVEQREPGFDGILSTVVSQMSAATVNASQQLIVEMRKELELKLKVHDPAKLVQWRPSIRAWIAVFVELIAMSSLALLPSFDFPRLIARQLDPISPIAPATTTRILMVSGNMEVSQGNSVTIQARVKLPMGDNVVLRTMTDGQDWVSNGMAPNPDGTWTRSLAALNRDVTYEIRAGDATAGPYHIRVQQPPIPREIKVRFTYPGYVAKSQLTINRAQGVLEAPAGTTVRLTVVATEPVRSAWFVINGQRQVARKRVDPQTRTFEFTLTEDVNISVEMISERGVRGGSLDSLRIHSIHDNPPIVRLLTSPGFSLLGFEQSAWISYQASDDYGMSTLEAKFDIQDKTVDQHALLMSDLRQATGEFKLDLPTLNAKPGQIVDVSLVAKDLAGQSTVASPVQFLVTSELVDVDWNRRVFDLREASRLAATAHSNVDLARQILEPHAEGDPIVVRQRSLAKTALASEASAVLVRTLIRAGIDSNREDISRAIAGLADSAQLQATALEQAYSRGIEESADVLQKRLAPIQMRAADVEQSIDLLCRGIEGELILAQRRALTATVLTDSPDSNRLREELDTHLLQLGLEPRALDLDAQLQSRVDSARKFEQAALPIDFAPVVAQWLASAGKDLTAVPQRLSVAAQCEALRADGDIVYARDLELSSRAVRLAASPANSARLTSQSLNEISTAVGVLLKRDARSSQVAIATARESLVGFAGELNALAQGRVVLDKQEASKPPIDTKNASRDAAFEIVRRWQQYLAELPQRLAAVEQAADACAQSRSRLDEAIHESESGAPEGQPVAQSAVEAMRTLNEESIRSLVASSESLDPAQAIAMARELRRAGTEGYIAAIPIDQQLIASLTNLRNAVQKRDLAEIRRCAPEVRLAASASQQSLRDARQQLIERDPAIVAKWFAQRLPAATRPSTRPGRQTSALDFQSTWDDPIERLFRARLVGENFGLSLPQTLANTDPGDANDLERSWNTYLENAATEPEPPAFKDALDAYFQALSDRQN
ncbi:MAG TPA: hypothetical protein VHD56_04825 [Tepidisphaeraceae bacterium]|nr:hypothetical protein [Tepidisphaeraceae bacterium]